jgi:hypothetical protein
MKPAALIKEYRAQRGSFKLIELTDIEPLRLSGARRTARDNPPQSP